MDKQTQFDIVHDLLARHRRGTVHTVRNGVRPAIRLGYDSSDDIPCSIILVDDTWYLISGYTQHASIDINHAVDKSTSNDLLGLIASWWQY